MNEDLRINQLPDQEKDLDSVLAPQTRTRIRTDP